MQMAGGSVRLHAGRSRGGTGMGAQLGCAGRPDRRVAAGHRDL